jgi:hypothetical protein
MALVAGSDFTIHPFPFLCVFKGRILTNHFFSSDLLLAPFFQKEQRIMTTIKRGNPLQWISVLVSFYYWSLWAPYLSGMSSMPSMHGLSLLVIFSCVLWATAAEGCGVRVCFSDTDAGLTSWM